MSEPEVVCPECGGELNLDADETGTVECPHCGAEIEPPGNRSDDLLAAYSASQQESRSWFDKLKRGIRDVSAKVSGDKIKAGLGQVSDQVKARKLRNRLKGLENALETQYEKLGRAALEHMPDQPDFQQRVEQLREVQEKIANQETTLQSLEEGAPGAAVRETKEQLGRLRRQERTIVVSIGREIAEARPEMPGAESSYTSIDNLAAMRQRRQAELAEMESEAGPEGQQTPPAE